MNHTQPNAKFLARLQKRYAKATKKQRIGMLDEFVATTGYHRKHASALLSGQRQWRDPDQRLFPAGKAPGWNHSQSYPPRTPCMPVQQSIQLPWNAPRVSYLGKAIIR